MKIVVTGIGAVCSIGINTEECLEALCQKRSGIGEIQYLNTAHKKRFRLGEVKKSNEELQTMLKLNGSKIYSRTTLLAMLAAREALQMAKSFNFGEKRTGIVSSTTVGGMDVTEQHYLKDSLSAEHLQTHPCGYSTKEVAYYIGAQSYYTTINTACSSGANAVIHGVRLLKAGILDRVVVGGVDALSMFTLNGFNSLMILDDEDCRPFDNNRKGLNLGEGAGFIVLEREDSANKYLCSLSGYANANDAYHQTASSPNGEGAYKAMLSALNMSGFQREDISYINVHGTGTNNNDLSEGHAMKRLYEDSQLPPFSSTKAYTGHTLAGAAGIEAVFSVMAIQNNIIYPNLRFKEPIEELNLTPSLNLITDKKVNHVMSNSFGFGGNSSTLIFSK